MNKKEILSLILKVIVGCCVAVGAAFGISVLTSCSAYKNVAANGKTTIITADTTNIDHSAGFSVEIKRK